jgi:hypothetical protein
MSPPPLPRERANPSAPARGELQIDSEDSFARREHVVDSLGWLLLAALVAAALAGLLGTGPVSSARAASPSGRVALDYQRITHREADDRVVVEIGPGTGRSGTLTIQLAGEWLDDLELRQVTPAPAEETGTPDGMNLSIPVSGGGPVRVVLSFRTRAIGPVDGVIRFGGEEIGFTQLVLP